MIVFRNGPPFDAFDGRRLEPKRILEAMFGQTDGSGLAAAHGLVPGGAGLAEAEAPARGDGVKVHVTVPAEIKAAMAAALPVPAPGRAAPRELPVERQAQGRRIKIVEFDGEGRPARELGR